MATNLLQKPEPEIPPFVPDDDRPILLTERAVQMVKEARDAEDLSSHALRVFIQGGGCAGFQYGLDFEQEPRASDFQMNFNGLPVFVDPISAMHLEGTVIDYVMGVSGAGFKFNNPAAKTTCGCGSSFG